MGSKSSGCGLSKVNIDLVKRVGIHSSNKMPHVFERIMIPFIENILDKKNMPAQARTDIVARTMADLFDMQHGEARQSVSFRDGTGAVSIFTFGYQKVTFDSENPQYRWFVIASEGFFSLMPDYFVLRITKCRFLKNNSRDEINTFLAV